MNDQVRGRGQGHGFPPNIPIIEKLIIPLIIACKNRLVNIVLIESSSNIIIPILEYERLIQANTISVAPSSNIATIASSTIQLV